MLTTTLLMALVAFLAVLTAPSLASGQGFQLVVNSSNQVSSLSKEQVSRMLLKKLTQWPGGGGVRPADQAPDRSVRQRFSEFVHGRSADAIKAYWQRQIFSGRETPPPELASDTAVIDYVRSHPGAIGYVSGGASLGRGVKALRVTE